ncbi:MAG: hypothetical protein A2044_01990 [Candidatus Firestonebacteria bacterium GWA2_43_8]|nr:MAG: hypothetical protein A2044_01990 [Candidatus Firestonebacteria bacterium GWA2_43_8]
MNEDEDLENTAEMIDPNITKEMLEQKLKKRIARKAYDIYIYNNRRPGNDLNNWLEAEKQVLIEFRKQYIHLYM